MKKVALAVRCAQAMASAPNKDVSATKQISLVIGPVTVAVSAPLALLEPFVMLPAPGLQDISNRAVDTESASLT